MCTAIAAAATRKVACIRLLAVAVVSRGDYDGCGDYHVHCGLTAYVLRAYNHSNRHSALHQNSQQN
jgi:hypothetical protein